MSVVGKSVGDPTPVQAYQPVGFVSSNGTPVAASVPAADGSTRQVGVNGTSLASAANPVATTDTPNTLVSSAPLTVQTSVAAGSLVAKAAAGNCYGFNVVSGASAGYFMLFNSTTAPVDGTVTPFRVYVMAANASLGVHWDVPRRFSTGIVGVFSSTGPFSKTISATAFIAIDYV